MWNLLQSILSHWYFVLSVFFGRRCLVVSVKKQTMFFLCGYRILRTFVISTGKNGTGEVVDSGKTPRGWFWIDEKIGDGASIDTVFKARQPIGLYRACEHKYDPILTRIMWLKGLQTHNKITKSRYIYIHGTPKHQSFGERPMSEGCVRMLDTDCLELFNQIELKTLVYICDEDNRLAWQYPFLLNLF